MIESHRREQRVNEKISNSMEKNLKVLFMYLNKVKKKKVEISSLKVKENYENDLKTICIMLIDQYKSGFITKSKENSDDEVYNQINKIAITDFEGI